MNKIAITLGDPCGIGPEITLKALQSFDNEIMLIGNTNIINRTLMSLNLTLPKNVKIIDIPCEEGEISIGKNCIEGGKTSYLAIEKACSLAKSNRINAIVTAPTSKKAMNMAGFAYSGQTEVIEFLLNQKNKAEMLFVLNDLRVMLLTRHLPLTRVAKEITIESIVQKVITLDNSLKIDFKIESPKIGMAALNPHAGEDGVLGLEELDIIIPAVSILKNNYQIDISGPFPADTMFSNVGKNYYHNNPQKYDGYIACYHDQGLIPIKMLDIKKTVNTTIGLDILRTSPAHGTAFDIAGKGIADEASMKAAIELALST